MVMRILGVLVSVILAGCGRGAPAPPTKQPEHPLLRTLRPPPLNLPVKSAQIPSESPGLPPGNEPALLVVSEGSPFQGSATLSGRLTVGSGMVEITAQDKRRLQILYRLPEGLPALPSADVNGELSIIERSGPGGPNRRIILRSDGSLLLAQIWLRSSEPATMQLGDGLRIAQRPVQRSTSGPRLVEVLVEVAGGDTAPAAISVRKPAQVRTRSGVLQAFVESSHFAYWAGPTDKHDGRYILKAWVVHSRNDPP